MLRRSASLLSEMEKWEWNWRRLGPSPFADIGARWCDWPIGTLKFYLLGSGLMKNNKLRHNSAQPLDNWSQIHAIILSAQQREFWWLRPAPTQRYKANGWASQSDIQQKCDALRCQDIHSFEFVRKPLAFVPTWGGHFHISTHGRCFCFEHPEPLVISGGRKAQGCHCVGSLSFGFSFRSGRTSEHVLRGLAFRDTGAYRALITQAGHSRASEKLA